MNKPIFGIMITFFLLFSCQKENPAPQDKTTQNIDTSVENSTETQEKPFYIGKNIYETEEEYLNALYDMNYWRYRNRILYRCLDKNDFSYFETYILDSSRLVGNQLDNDYMELIREVIHIKNNLTFGNKEIDDYFMEKYEYYDPKNLKKLTENENKILQQINSRLYPQEERIAIDKLNEIISGVWQKNNYDIYADYQDTLRFSDSKMAIKTNVMDSRRKFHTIEGTYEIINNNIIMKPEYYDYINGGKFVESDKNGLVERYYGAQTERITLSPNGIISYPIISISKIFDEFENRHYYKLTLFIDRPTVYYKVSEEWK